MLRKRKYATHYGEYSLKNWIRMILNGEITLPDYQRYFVWTVDQSIELIDSLTKGVFVPPVVLASYRGDDSIKAANYILDGQQRLSSILLIYLGYWPTKFIAEEVELANEDSQSEDDSDLEIKDEIKDDDVSPPQPIMQSWNFLDIQKKYKTCSNIEELKGYLDKDGRYEKIDSAILKSKSSSHISNMYVGLNISDKIFRESFLGYSFINGIRTSSDEEKKLFSDIFRRINISGKKLTSAESRAAFYWLNPERKEFFKPHFLANVRINNKEIDWARTLAFTAEAARIYASKGNTVTGEIRVAVGFGSKYNTFENYIERYVKSVVDDTDDPLFKCFEQSFLRRLGQFEIDYNKFIKLKEFSSFVDADFYIWGLLFWVVFQGNKLKDTDYTSLHQKLQGYINPAKMVDELKSVNRLGRIRNRMKQSIITYLDFMV